MRNAYRQALDYLHSFTDYEVRSGYTYDAARFDLVRVHRLLSLLGDPHRAFRSVHIAGTKGKGSTCAMLASILSQSGYRTGLYISPHLHTFRERAQVDGEMMSEEAVVAGTDRLRQVAPQVKGITTFELITALAFDYLHRQRAELAVIEVGMGGRLDATNVITPMVSVIAPISYDHMMYLGDTLSAIAGEKAGIIKPGVPVVSAPQPLEAQRTISEIADVRGSDLILVGRDWSWRPLEAKTDGQTFSAWPSAHPDKAERYSIPLIGAHQLVNATTALATVDVLRRQGLSVPEHAVQAGLETVRWPGRAEVLGQEPWVIVDGAHNADSMQKLCETVQSLFSYRDMILIYGASADKDIGGMLDAILPLARHVLVAESGHPRAAPTDKLMSDIESRGVHAEPVSIQDAIARALARATRQDLVCVTGSLYLVAAFRLEWLKHVGAPLPPHDGK